MFLRSQTIIVCFCIPPNMGVDQRGFCANILAETNWRCHFCLAIYLLKIMTRNTREWIRIYKLNISISSVVDIDLVVDWNMLSEALEVHHIPESSHPPLHFSIDEITTEVTWRQFSFGKRVKWQIILLIVNC